MSLTGSRAENFNENEDDFSKYLECRTCGTRWVFIEGNSTIVPDHTGPSSRHCSGVGTIGKVGTEAA